MSVESRGLAARMEQGPVLCAAGYLFEAERRGYLTAGEFVPEIALEHPEVLLQITKDYLASGSDVSLAFTYNGHREKMRILGKAELLEPLNRSALEVARRAADEHVAEHGGERPLVAGNVSNTNIFDPSDSGSEETVRGMFREMCEWAAESGVDFIQGETFYFGREAEIALEEIKRVGLPGVVMIAVFATGELMDGDPVEACKRLADQGALAVGMNCFRGPRTSLPILEQIAREVPGYLAAQPAAVRTVPSHPTFFNLPDPCCGIVHPKARSFPDSLESQMCNRFEMAEFGVTARELGYRFIGICCGNQPIHMRAMAEALGRKTVLSRYSSDTSKHFIYGDDPTLRDHITAMGSRA